MGQSFFQFKQFRIEQGGSAMKVCTDACILGAYATFPQPKRILDIGSGTGLLALMLAQRYPVHIDTVEIEQNAWIQTKENIQNSPWPHLITAHHQPIQAFSKKHPTGQYDLIVSNPPFFDKHLPSANAHKNMALHTQNLKFSELANITYQLLTENGRFFILLPERQSYDFFKEAEKSGLKVNEMLCIKDKKTTKILRIVSTLSKQVSQLQHKELIIKNEDGSYADAFKNLLKDYYLIF
jgi:tRNA1Val (adenine37-N6)-methyltransferase